MYVCMYVCMYVFDSYKNIKVTNQSIYHSINQPYVTGSLIGNATK